MRMTSGSTLHCEIVFVFPELLSTANKIWNYMGYWWGIQKEEVTKKIKAKAGG
jgi:hypothetical protein